jgi:hypothetical protein
VAVLGQRILHHRSEGLVLAAGRDDLAADRVVGVLGIDQADEVRRDVDPELVGGRQPFALLVGQLEDLFDLIELVDPVGQLPAPVVPLLVGDVLVDRRASADSRSTSAAACSAAWCAIVVLISWASNRLRPPASTRERCIESMHSASRRMIAPRYRRVQRQSRMAPIRSL